MIKPYKAFKINRNDYENIYFCSDLHRQHNKSFIWTPRGFDAAWKHDKFIDDNCAKLTENDLLIFLGDVALNSSYEETFNFIKGIRAQKFWIWGNHYSWEFPIYERALTYFWNIIDRDCVVKIGESHVYPLTVNLYNYHTDGGFRKQNTSTLFENLITFFGNSSIFNIGNMFYHCSHFAPAIWDKMKYDNQVCLCGHSHGNFKNININSNELGKILDVGVDNAIKHNGTCFFKVEEVEAIMRKKTIKIHDHHN